MGRGRRSVPSSANDGNWFRHRGEPGDLEGRLRDTTSTREMLEAPFSAPVKPRAPPQIFQGKEEVIYSSENPFTQHDNRHYFQEHGVYLGNGRDTRTLGRRLHPVDDRLHHTEQTYLHHRARPGYINPSVQDYHSVTSTCFRSPGSTELPSHRRFPRVYKSNEPSKETKPTDWSSAPSTKATPLNVLAASQEPFLPHNSWRYSFSGSSKVYPPYDRKPRPAVHNILNRYGPNFASTQHAGVRVD